MKITNISNHLSTHKLREIEKDVINYSKGQRRLAKKLLLKRGEIVTL